MTQGIGAPSARNTLSALEHFLGTPIDALLAGAGAGAGVEAALRLFHEVAANVPAYARFLAQRGVDPRRVRTPADFARLPATDKDGYLRPNRLPELCREGRLEGCDLLAVSSGSTGTPTFWPRALRDEFLVAERFEQVFHDAFHADRRRTLVVVCFALGTWVGGLYTLACCRHLAAKGYPLTVVAPGNDKAEIFRVVEALGPQFEQTVLAGYPPFVKDLIDTGRARGLDWAALDPKLLLAGEVFSEEWRALVHARAGVREALSGSASLYGTADAGVLGNETPLSVLARRWLAGRPEVARELFGKSRLPTLVQYDPRRRHFELIEGTLAFSGDNGVPLVRYNIGDEGGLYGFGEFLERLREAGLDLLAAARAAGVRAVRDMPFLYVFGRSHFVLSWFGANIYPENVSVGLEQPEVHGLVTGKFVMQLVEDADRDGRLELHVELAPGERDAPGRAEAVGACVLRELRRLNSEFAHYVPPERQAPRLVLHPHGDPQWFPPGVKHRYTRR